MPDRRNLALLLVAVCSVALLPALMPADEMLDPLAPMAPLTRLATPQHDASMRSLHQQASAALLALRTAAVKRPSH